MSREERRSRPRGRPGRDAPNLSEERIFAAALELVDDEGLGALSMRRLARELDVDPMSIYHHVPNKAAVVAGAVRLAFSQMRMPRIDDPHWMVQVKAWALAYHDLVLRHPNLVLHIVTDPAAVGIAAAIIDDPIRRALRAGGLTAETVAAATGVLVDYVNGFALAEVGGPETRGASAPTAAGLEFGIDLIVLGLQALAADAELQADVPGPTPRKGSRP